MIVVKNERIDPWIFQESRNKKTFLAGAISVLTDQEWNSVPISKRGPGQLNPLWPNDATSDTKKLEIEYFNADGAGNYQVRYIGSTTQAALVSEQVWTVKKFVYTSLAGASSDPIRVTEVQVLQDVAWTDRATLPWT